VRLAVHLAFLALLCATTSGMAQDGAGRPNNRPVNPGVVRQADVDPRTITLPVVNGKVSVSHDSPRRMGYHKRRYPRLCRTIRASCGLVHSMG
jgi:hypothetical protein